MADRDPRELGAASWPASRLCSPCGVRATALAEVEGCDADRVAPHVDLDGFGRWDVKSIAKTLGGMERALSARLQTIEDKLDVLQERIPEASKASRSKSPNRRGKGSKERELRILSKQQARQAPIELPKPPCEVASEPGDACDVLQLEPWDKAFSTDATAPVWDSERSSTPHAKVMHMTWCPPSEGCTLDMSTRLSNGSMPSFRRKMSMLRLNDLLPQNWDQVESRSKMLEMVWIFFEEPGSSMAAKFYHRFMFALTFLSAFVPILQTVPGWQLSAYTFFVLSTLLDCVFLVEMCTRWAVCPSFFGFLRGFYNILDLCMIGPLVLRIAIYSAEGSTLWEEQDGVARAVLLCFVPAFRVVKALRNLEHFGLLVHTLSAIAEPLSMPIILMCVIITVFSSFLFVVEPRDNLNSIPHAMWLVFVTVTTVGYGEVVPVTSIGRIVVSLVIMVGMMCFAMPIAIVGHAFTVTWKNRVRIVVLARMRARLHQWRYTTDDVRVMFKNFDVDESGELDIDEFQKMVNVMRLGLSVDDVKRTFEAFDVDGSNSIDMDEFCDALNLQPQGTRAMALF